MGLDEEYLRNTQTKYYYGSAKKSKCSFSCHLQIDKKISTMQIKIDPRGKIHSNFFAYEILLVRTIYLFTPQEAEIVDNPRYSSSVVNSLGSFYGAP